ETLDDQERARLRAMLNFDMVGFGNEPWYLIGSSEMQQQAGAIAEKLGIEAEARGGAGTGVGSDHASFMDVGIPAVFFHRAEEPEWHQPGDTIDRLGAALLEEAARMGVAMLE